MKANEAPGLARGLGATVPAGTPPQPAAGFDSWGVHYEVREMAYDSPQELRRWAEAEHAEVERLQQALAAERADKAEVKAYADRYIDEIQELKRTFAAERERAEKWKRIAQEDQRALSATRGELLSEIERADSAERRARDLQRERCAHFDRVANSRWCAQVSMRENGTTPAVIPCRDELFSPRSVVLKADMRVTAAEARAEAAEAEVERLTAAKLITLGRCKVLIANAHVRDSTVENEVLILDGEGRKACMGQRFDEFEPYETSDKCVLVRLVVAHPDGAAVLIEKLERAAEEAERAIERGERAEKEGAGHPGGDDHYASAEDGTVCVDAAIDALKGTDLDEPGESAQADDAGHDPENTNR